MWVPAASVQCRERPFVAENERRFLMEQLLVLLSHGRGRRSAVGSKGRAQRPAPPDEPAIWYDTDRQSRSFGPFTSAKTFDGCQAGKLPPALYARQERWAG